MTTGSGGCVCGWCGLDREREGRAQWRWDDGHLGGLFQFLQFTANYRLEREREREREGMYTFQEELI